MKFTLFQLDELIEQNVRKILKESILGNKTKTFITLLDTIRHDRHASTWMWLYQYCNRFNIDESYFDDDVKSLGGNFNNIAITGETFASTMKALKLNTDVKDLEKLAKKSGIKYIVSGYMLNNSILWVANQ